MKVVVNADSTTTVKDSTKPSKFYNILQFCDAVDVRMHYMLRCGYPDCAGFIPSHERGPFMEYCVDLKLKAYEYELESLLDYDTELMEMRKMVEWSFDQTVPPNLQSVNWRKKPTALLRCCFCQRLNHTHHTCAFKASEEELPPPKGGANNVCTHYNAALPCPDGEQCKMQHICVLCNTPNAKHQVFRCPKLQRKLQHSNNNKTYKSNARKGRGGGGGRGKKKQKKAPDA